MKFKGNYWIAIQDIGGFTTLSEELSKKGKRGTELLSSVIGNFFKEAEERILECNGRIFKLAGDAYYAMFPADVNPRSLKTLGNELLNLNALKKNNLKTRFVAVSGFVEGELLQVSDHYQDLLVNGKALYDLSTFEEKTPAGRVFVLPGMRQKSTTLPDFPSISHKIRYPPRHSPSYIMFLEVPEDFGLVHEVTSLICKQEGKIKLVKWIPFKNTFKALLIAGFPESTGKEAELCIDLYNRLRLEFKGYRLRIGVGAGVVFAGEIKTKKFHEFAVLGDTVNIAARLCAIVPENNIYFSEEIQKELIGRYNFTDMGLVKLKGKKEKIRIYKIQERISGIFNPALFSYEFVGREKEFRSALGLIKENKNICLVGEGGVGKSRMLYELRKKITQKNIIEVALSPISPPLYLLKEILKYFSEDRFSELKNYFDGVIQLPKARVIELLRKLFKTKPNLIIFTEDLQWIDGVSLMLLKDLLPLPFQAIASTRPDGEKYADILRLEKIFFSNLSPEALKRLFKSVAGAPPDNRLFNFLLERTQGNPFYFEQIMRDLKEKQLIFNKGSQYSISDDARTLPFSIHSLLLSRFNALSRNARTFLEIGACIGMEFHDNTMQRILGRKKIELKPIIDRNILIRDRGVYQFRHALFREAILDSMLIVLRQKYERLIGETFIKEGRHSYEIAQHLTDGAKPYKALPYWADTFEELYRQGFQAEIAKIIQKLNNYEDEQTRNISAYINALYLIKVSDYYDAEQILLRLKKIALIKKEVLFGLAGLYDWSSQYPKMGKILQELAHYPLSIKENLARIELQGIYYDMNDNNRMAIRMYRKALAIARKNNLIQPLVTHYYNIGWIYFKQYNYLKAENYFLQSLKFVKEGDLFNEAVALLRLGEIEMLKRNFEVSKNYLQKSLKNLQTISFPYWERIALSALTNLYVLLDNKTRARYFAIRHDEVANAAQIDGGMILRFLLYYRDLQKVETIIKGKEKIFPFEYFLLLLGRGRSIEAFKFLKENNLESMIPDRKVLRKNTFPLNNITLYKKYAQT